MATSTEGAIDREALIERVPVIGGSLVVIAGLAVGSASFVDGVTPGFRARLPVYALVGAVGFAATLLALRYSPRDRRAVLRNAALVGVLGFFVVGLWAEAIVYGLILVAPSMALYLLSAVIVCCGLGYWSLRSWHAVNDLTRPW